MKKISVLELKVINEIINRGNTAEVRSRKDDVVIYEVIRKTKKVVAAADGQ